MGITIPRGTPEQVELSEAAKIMDMIEYLKALREADQEWVIDFRARYNIPAQRVSEDVAPSDWYEVHSHHAEFGSSAH